MNGYDSDMAPELLLRSGKRTTEPALSRSWRLLQASTKLKCVKGPCEIEDLKRRLTGTSRPHGKDDGHQRLQDGVSEDERWSLIKMVNLQVNRLQDGCSGDEMRAAWATSSESSNGNSEKQRNELAAAAHGKTGRPAQELNHVNLVQELLALREAASRVNVAHHMWRHTTGGQGAATVSSSHAQLEPTANAMSAAAPSALTRHAASMRAAATAVLPAPPG